MVKIRLTRMGRHKLPYFRMVAMDSRSRRDGKYIKQVGTYEPLSGKITINEQEILVLLNQGAQPTDTVKSFLRKEGIWKKFMDSKVQLKKENSKDKSTKKEKSSKPSVKKTTKPAATKKVTTKSASSKQSVKKTTKK